MYCKDRALSPYKGAVGGAQVALASLHIAKKSSDTVNPRLWAAANQLRKRGGKKLFSGAISNLKVTNSKEVQGIIKAAATLTFDSHHKQHLTVGLSIVKYFVHFDIKHTYPQEYIEGKHILEDILILATPIILHY